VNLKDYLVTRQKLIDRALDRYLPKAKQEAHHASPGYALQFVCRRKTLAADFVPGCG
jgi:hypothetical protein